MVINIILYDMCFVINVFTVRFVYYSILRFLLSSDIRSEGSIAIVKKHDFDFLKIF